MKAQRVLASQGGTRVPPCFFACFTVVELVRLKDLKGAAINLNRNQATSTVLFSPKRTAGRSMPLSVSHKSIFSTRPDGSERHVTHRKTNHALRDKILHLSADQDLKHMNLYCGVQSDGPTAVRPQQEQPGEIPTKTVRATTGQLTLQPRAVSDP